MKTIGSIKLHKKGQEGISISSSQLSKSIIDLNNNEIYQDKVDTFRQHVVPPHILNAICRLKYFFLRITGYWISVYDQYLDTESFLLTPISDDAKQGRLHLEALWQRTHVTQIKISENDFTIMGMMEIIESKPLNLNPTKITPEDELDFYGNARDIIKGVIGLLVQYFSTAAINEIEDYRLFLLDNANENGKQEIAKFDETQIINRVMDELSKTGAIIMMEGDKQVEALPETVAYETEAVDPVEAVDPLPKPESELPPETVEMDSGEDWKHPDDKPKDAFGPPAAEDNLSDDAMASPIKEEAIDDLPSEDFEV